MDFYEAITKGKVIVVAGAGISKEPPSNLPSWWDYNIILLNMIGKIGAEQLGETNNLLDTSALIEKLSLVSISEFLVDRVAGKSYYPLLELLDSSNPNINHYMLAKLAKEGKISGIITTNFDSLIETAFENLNVNFSLFDKDDDYYNKDQKDSFPIYKIHGSARNAKYAIDTVHQKLQGLTFEKKIKLKEHFANNHVLFMGFSGEDYLFGSDYIPIQENKINNYGVTWIAHPGSKFNNTTSKLINELNIDVITDTLTNFYKKQFWENPENTNLNTICSDESFTNSAKIKIRELLESPHIGSWTCVGLCIQLLDNTNEIELANKIIEKTENILKEKLYIDLNEGFERAVLYTSMAVHFQNIDNISKALHYSVVELNIYNNAIKTIDTNTSPKLYKELAMNRSTVKNRMGLIEMYKENADLNKTGKIFLSAFYDAFIGQHWENMADILANFAQTEFYLFQKEHIKAEKVALPKFVSILFAARRLAEHSGSAQVQFNINCLLVNVYTYFGQKNLAKLALKKAKELNNLCIVNHFEIHKKGLLYLEEQIDSINIKVEQWQEYDIKISELYNEESIWQPFGNGPLLDYEEGRYAKSLYDNDKRVDCIKYIINTAESYCDNNQYISYLLFDCLLGIFLDIVNNSSQNSIVRHKYLDNAKYCLDKCVFLAIYLGRIDLLIETTGSLAQVIYMIDGLNNTEYLKFLCEFTLCVCNDPSDCWQTILALQSLIYITKQEGRKELLRKYCKQYIEETSKKPELVSEKSIQQIKNILQELDLE